MLVLVLMVNEAGMQTVLFLEDGDFEVGIF